MISVSQAVTQIIKASPFLEEGLHRGIISYAALARDIKTQVEEQVFKQVTSGSIIMAIKRYTDMQKIKKGTAMKPLVLENLTVRSNLTELTYSNSPTMPDTYKALFSLSGQRKDLICSISQGVKETTIVISESMQRDVEKIFRKEVFVAELNRLSSISISLPKTVVYAPGAYYLILKKLAWENINIVEVLSTYTELTIIVSSADVDKAFTLLRR